LTLQRDIFHKTTAFSRNFNFLVHEFGIDSAWSYCAQVL